VSDPATRGGITEFCELVPGLLKQIILSGRMVASPVDGDRKRRIGIEQSYRDYAAKSKNCGQKIKDVLSGV